MGGPLLGSSYTLRSHCESPGEDLGGSEADLWHFVLLSAGVMEVPSAPVLREEASSSRRSFEDLVRLPLAPLTLQRARILARASLHRRLGLRVGGARKQVSASSPPNQKLEFLFLAGYRIFEPHACPPYQKT